MADDAFNRAADAYRKKVEKLPPPTRVRKDAPMDGVIVAAPGESFEEARRKAERAQKDA